MTQLTVRDNQAAVPPPSYNHMQAKRGHDLHINALTLVTTLHLLLLCRMAVRMAHRRCPPPLPAGPGGSPRTYSEESLLLINLLRTLWRLSNRAVRPWASSPRDIRRAARRRRMHFHFLITKTRIGQYSTFDNGRVFAGSRLHRSPGEKHERV
jgi:hypothetical protein